MGSGANRPSAFNKAKSFAASTFSIYELNRISANFTSSINIMSQRTNPRPAGMLGLGEPMPLPVWLLSSRHNLRRPAETPPRPPVSPAHSDWQLPRSKVPEGWRTPRRFAFAGPLRISARFWTAAALRRFSTAPSRNPCSSCSSAVKNSNACPNHPPKIIPVRMAGEAGVFRVAFLV
jgi:hypothetical protein